MCELLSIVVIVVVDGDAPFLPPYTLSVIVAQRARGGSGPFLRGEHKEKRDW